MDEKTLIIKGYQPTAGVQKGKEQGGFVSANPVMANLTPPKGGTGEITLKKK